MNAHERRQFEMLQRVREFGNTYNQSFPEGSVAPQAFAALSGLTEDLTVTDMAKMSASASARANRKAAARKALTDLLVKINHFGKVLRASGQEAPDFELPASLSDQSLLTAARQFAKDAAPLDAELTGHGMPASVLSDTTAAFEKALRDRGIGRGGLTAACTRIRELLASAMVELRRLDLVVSNDLAGDAVVQAVWKQARRVEDARPPHATTAPPAPAPDAEAA